MNVCLQRVKLLCYSVALLTCWSQQCDNEQACDEQHRADRCFVAHDKFVVQCTLLYCTHRTADSTELHTTLHNVTCSSSFIIIMFVYFELTDATEH